MPTTRVAVFTGPNQPLEFREYPLREPRGEEILVRVTCCTICGSDLHTYTGRRPGPIPGVLGHEIIGCIEQFGPAAPRQDLMGQAVHEGDRITWTLAASCRACFFCKHDLPQKCERLFKYGHEPLTSENPLNGGMADHCFLVQGTGMMRLPDDLPDAIACPANCATATVAAALRVAGGCHGRTVLIQGAGMLGLTACAMAEQQGAEAVICCDIREDRLPLASRFGATRVGKAESNELEELVKKVTEGRGVDLALELSGVPESIELGLPLLRIGGRYAWVGTVTPTRSVAVVPEQIVRRHLTIHGVHNYAPLDLARAVEFLTKGQHLYPFGDLVGESFSLAKVNGAISKALEGTAARVAVRP